MASFPDKEIGVSLGHEIKEQPSSFYLSLLHSSEHAGPYQQAEINCSHNYIISKKTDAQTLVLLKKTTTDFKIKNTRDLGLKPDKNQHAGNTLERKKKRRRKARSSLQQRKRLHSTKDSKPATNYAERLI